MCINSFFRVFWVNIAKSGVYLCYTHCFKLFRELRKEGNSTKVWERKGKSGREKILNFSNHITEILVAQIAAQVGVKCPKGNQLWQCHCWNRGKKFVAIVAMPLLKMGEKKSKFGEELKKKKILHQQYFYNIFTINYRWLVKVWI